MFYNSQWIKPAFMVYSKWFSNTFDHPCSASAQSYQEWVWGCQRWTGGMREPLQVLNPTLTLGWALDNKQNVFPGQKLPSKSSLPQRKSEHRAAKGKETGAPTGPAAPWWRVPNKSHFQTEIRAQAEAGGSGLESRQWGVIYSSKKGSSVWGCTHNVQGPFLSHFLVTSVQGRPNNMFLVAQKIHFIHIPENPGPSWGDYLF